MSYPYFNLELIKHSLKSVLIHNSLFICIASIIISLMILIKISEICCVQIQSVICFNSFSISSLNNGSLKLFWMKADFFSKFSFGLFISVSPL